MLWWWKWKLRSKVWPVRQDAVQKLGASGSRRAVRALIRALHDESSAIRKWAAEGLARIGDRRAVGPLAQMLTDDKRLDIDVYEFSYFGGLEALECLEAIVLNAIATIGGAKADLILLESLCSSNWKIQHGAKGAIDGNTSFWLTRNRKKAAVPKLLEALDSSDSAVRVNAADALGKIGDRSAAERLRRCLSHYEPTCRCMAALALARIGDHAGVDSLVSWLDDEIAEVREYSADALGEVGDTKSVDSLREVLGDPSHRVRCAAVGSLRRLGWAPESTQEEICCYIADGEWKEVESMGSVAIDAVVVLFDDDSSALRRRAALILGNLGDRRAIKPLLSARVDSEKNVRKAAEKALCRLDAQWESCRQYKEFLAECRERLTLSDSTERLQTVQQLGLLGTAGVVDLLQVASKDKSGRVAAEARLLLEELRYDREVEQPHAAEATRATPLSAEATRHAEPESAPNGSSEPTASRRQGGPKRTATCQDCGRSFPLAGAKANEMKVLLMIQGMSIPFQCPSCGSISCSDCIAASQGKSIGAEATSLTLTCSCGTQREMLVTKEYAKMMAEVDALDEEERHLENAISLANSGRVNDAIKEASKALKCVPDSYNAYYIRGRLRVELGDRRGMVSDFKKALQYAPYDWEYRNEVELYTDPTNRRR